ncbi:MAG: hypothetical protein GKR91_11535 [Pseudomonadales bacterium]|nr:hypothetical protein [Pseudomonadales bacterium]
MPKKTIIIKFDINGFNKKAQSSSVQKTAEFLSEYYELIAAESANLNWRFIKTIGDCVLVSADENNSHEVINRVHKNIQNVFSINTCYRECEYEELNTTFGDYSCRDTIGKDINGLFLGDENTVSISS